MVEQRSAAVTSRGQPPRGTVEEAELEEVCDSQTLMH